MDATDILRNIAIAIFALASLVAAREWSRSRNRPALWAAAALTCIALANLAFATPETPPWAWTEKVGIALLLLFPWLLVLFSASFEPARHRRTSWAAGLVTATLVGWHLLLPDIPEDLEAWPGWLLPWVSAVLATWVVLALLVATRLWRAGSHQPAVVRQRMRTLAIATLGMAAGVLAAGFAPGAGGGALVGLTALSGVLFLVGFAPPAWLRVVWRWREQEAVREASAQLVAATSRYEMTDGFLPHLTALAGARATALVDGSGTCIGAHGVAHETAERAARALDSHRDVVSLDLPSGRLLVWTTPYMPLFGREELSLLRALGLMVHLALERAELLEERQHEQERVHDELRRADELKNRFLAMASHELRTPLTAIAGFTSTMLNMDDQLTTADRQRFLEIIEQQTRRLDRLVRDLLTLSRIEAGAVDASVEEVDVALELKQAVRDLGAQAEVSCEHDLRALADSHLLRQILSNYVTNALKYGSPPIRLEARAANGSVEIRVCDHGQGVPEEFVPRLFERFARARRADSDVEGTGLGLSIVHGLAQAQHGDVWYEPNEPHGAVFAVRLPRAVA